LIASLFMLWLTVGHALPTTLSKIREEAAPFPGSILYSPNDGKSHPGIVVLHGSEGGSLPFFQLEAQYLAAHGYVVLAYCWYNCAKNPTTSPLSRLENVELRNTIAAITWLKKSSAVGGHKVALTGFSRGAEESVLLGAQRAVAQLLDAIAVHTPSDTIVGGFSGADGDKRCWICSTPNMACFNDSDDSADWDWAHMRWNPSCGLQSPYPENTTAWLLDGTPFKIDDVIEIEKFKKPVFITVGDQDELWDYHKSVRLAERLKKYGQSVEIHIFPGEHHVFSYTNENVRHELLLAFLRKNL
jgi:dienelactone hydrolase